MRHTTLVAVLLMVCAATFAQPNLGDTYYYDGSAWNWSNLIYNDGTGVSIGTGTAPSSPFQLEIGGQVRTQMSDFYAETSSGNFADIHSFFGLSITGSGNYYKDPLGTFITLNGAVDATSFGFNSFGAVGFIFSDDFSNAGYFAGRRLGGTENVLNLQHISYDNNDENGKTLNMDNTIYELRRDQYDVSGTPTLVFENVFSLGDDNFTFDLFDATDHLTFTQHQTDGFLFAQNSTPLLQINTSGTIEMGVERYIGTTYNHYLLSVDGLILAKEFAMTTSDWADFVFEPSYCLRPLSEVKDFIAANGHLPDVPSAEYVAENGVELGEVNVMLLMKIEELTLYMLQQQEEIEELKRRLDE